MTASVTPDMLAMLTQLAGAAPDMTLAQILQQQQGVLQKIRQDLQQPLDVEAVSSAQATRETLEQSLAQGMALDLGARAGQQAVLFRPQQRGAAYPGATEPKKWKTDDVLGAVAAVSAAASDVLETEAEKTDAARYRQNSDLFERKSDVPLHRQKPDESESADNGSQKSQDTVAGISRVQNAQRLAQLHAGASAEFHRDSWGAGHMPQPFCVQTGWTVDHHERSLQLVDLIMLNERRARDNVEFARSVTEASAERVQQQCRTELEQLLYAPDENELIRQYVRHAATKTLDEAAQMVDDVMQYKVAAPDNKGRLVPTQVKQVFSKLWQDVSQLRSAVLTPVQQWSQLLKSTAEKFQNLKEYTVMAGSQAINHAAGNLTHKHSQQDIDRRHKERQDRARDAGLVAKFEVSLRHLNEARSVQLFAQQLITLAQSLTVCKGDFDDLKSSDVRMIDAIPPNQGVGDFLVEKIVHSKLFKHHQCPEFASHLQCRKASFPALVSRVYREATERNLAGAHSPPSLTHSAFANDRILLAICKHKDGPSVAHQAMIALAAMQQSFQQRDTPYDTRRNCLCTMSALRGTGDTCPGDLVRLVDEFVWTTLCHSKFLCTAAGFDMRRLTNMQRKRGDGFAHLTRLHQQSKHREIANRNVPGAFFGTSWMDGQQVADKLGKAYGEHSWSRQQYSRYNNGSQAGAQYHPRMNGGQQYEDDAMGGGYNVGPPSVRGVNASFAKTDEVLAKARKFQAEQASQYQTQIGIHDKTGKIYYVCALCQRHNPLSAWGCKKEHGGCGTFHDNYQERIDIGRIFGFEIKTPSHGWQEAKAIFDQQQLEAPARKGKGKGRKGGFRPVSKGKGKGKGKPGGRNPDAGGRMLSLRPSTQQVVSQVLHGFVQDNYMGPAQQGASQTQGLPPGVPPVENDNGKTFVIKGPSQG